MSASTRGSLTSGGNAELDAIRRLYVQERMSFREVAVRLSLPPWRVYRLMCEHGIPRRRGTEQNYATYKSKPQFLLNRACTAQEDVLKVAGSMLYWAEGAKRGKTVDCTNSDPRLIALFIMFLRRICGVAESRLRVHVYAYDGQDLERLKNFWSKITRVPPEQFIKPYVCKSSNGKVQGRMRWGLVHICYSDGRLLEIILRWAEQFAELWAGARVANWSSL